MLVHAGVRACLLVKQILWAHHLRRAVCCRCETHVYLFSMHFNSPSQAPIGQQIHYVMEVLHRVHIPVLQADALRSDGKTVHACDILAAASWDHPTSKASVPMQAPHRIWCTL